MHDYQNECEGELVSWNTSANDLLKLRGSVTVSYQIGGEEECRVRMLARCWK
jgi:hypothetical protein